MAPSTAHLANQLRQLIYYHLDNDLVSNALFCAGRLHGVDAKNPDAVHLLALCHSRSGQSRAAYDYSRSFGRKAVHLGCSYVFAQACLAIGRNAEGIAALEHSRPLWNGKSIRSSSDAARRYTPDAAAVNNLLGRLLLGIGDVKRAAEFFVEALKLNPFMWDAFENLCNIGAGIRTSNIFKSDVDSAALLVASYITTASLSPEEGLNGSNITQSQRASHASGPGSHGVDSYNSTRGGGESGLSLGGTNVLSKMNIGRGGQNNGNNVDFHTIDSHERHDTEFDMPESSDDTMGNQMGQNSEAPNAPTRKPRLPLQASMVELAARAGPSVSRTRIKQNLDPGDLHASLLLGTHKRTNSGSNLAGLSSNGAPQRRSMRLFGRQPSSAKIQAIPLNSNPGPVREMKKVRAPNPRGRVFPSATVGREVSGNRNAAEAAEIMDKEQRPVPVRYETTVRGPRLPAADLVREYEAMQWLLDLFSRLGYGYFEMSRFQCQTALEAFQDVSPHQRDTPWVLGQIGRALCELSRYREAEKVFATIKKMAPSRIEDMEIYSTVLWHLKNDMELAFLSHELVEADRLAPQSWCTIGNSFSLQRDHDQALKCFKRATQLDPNFAYGYTLQGHEHMSNEECEKALLAYRKAISADHRHYNGWYGLGKVYEKLGQYDMAEKHYRSAAYINPTNAILVTCIGVVLEKLKKPQAALAQYETACHLAPMSAITRFKKARLLLHMNCPREALAELKELEHRVPDESSVHFMLGRVYKMLHDKSNAVRYFTIAMNLDPKAQQYIKEVMETLDEEDDEEDVEDDDDDENMA